MTMVVRLALLACPLIGCNDNKVTSFNTAPSALIAYPTEGAVFAEGDLIALQGVVGDDDSPPTDLSAAWRVDGVDACAAAPAAADGDTRCEVTLEVGEHEVSLVVEDPGGQAASDTVNIRVEATEPPSASITAPADGATVVAGDLVSLQGVVADLEDGASELSAWWTVDGDRLEVDVTVDSDGDVTASTTFTEAAEHSLTLHVEDTDGKTASDTVTLTVQAAAGSPTCSIDSPGDDTVVDFEEGADFTATVADPDQSPETLTVTWTSDFQGYLGSSTADSAGSIEFSPTLEQADHTVSMVVTDDSGLTCSDYVTVIVDAAPAIEVLSPTSGGTVQEGDAVVVSVSVTDDRDDDEDLTVTWRSSLDGALGSGTPDSDGDLEFSLSLSVGSHTLTVTATDSNGFVATDTVSVTVNGRPSTPVVSISPPSPLSDDALTASLSTSSTDPEGGTVSYSYAWTRDGDSTGRTSATVPASATSKDELWVVTVIASDRDGGESAAATASVTIQDTPPELTSVSLTPSSPTVEDDLTANAAGSDVDGDSVSFTYAWTVGGSSVTESDPTLSSGFEKGDVVTVTVTPVADGLSGDSDSASRTIQNTPPTAPVLSITPSDPYAGEDTLTCEIDASSTDADDDEITYDVAWTVDGSTSGVSGYTVGRSLTSPGEFWVCTVTPSDDEEAGDSATASVTVLGDPVDYAHLQWPCSVSAATGEEIDVYGWVYVVGVTDGSGEGGDIEAQVGFGPTTADPSVDDSSWTWFDAAYNTDKDGLAPGDLANDEYAATMIAPSSAGTYAYAYRFSTDYGASWVYADLGDDCGGVGTIDGFDLADAGEMTVE